LSYSLFFGTLKANFAYMKFTNPIGTKSITLRSGENMPIHIEDLEPGSRDFSLEIILDGEGSRCDIIGRVSAADKDVKNWKIMQRFLGTNSVGNIKIHGVAEGDSRLEIDASGILEQESVDAEANITEKIMLFDQARARALPVLTVKTDRVKSASHGASIAPVDPQQILYLMSRGISEEEALGMLREGFLK
jgi:Fe-S cluster assembly scaffold protein SufB